MRPVLAGVPQGSVISPVLFNHYVSDYPSSAPLITSYADDFTAAASATRPSEAAAIISDHASDVAPWAASRGLTISISKSHSSLFSPHTRETNSDPGVTWLGGPLHSERNPKILGVTFDPLFTFAPHIRSVADRASARLNVLRALAGTSWGQSKETILLTYKLLSSSIIHYAAPIWYPNASDTSISRLQLVQNAALRIATGSLKMASADHLLSEAQFLPI